MKTAHIVYRNYLNADGQGMSIGGIQTYLTNLVIVLHDLNFHVIIYQRGDIDFHKIINNGLEVYGCKRPNDKVKGRAQMLYKKALTQIKPENKDILIFGCESLAVKTDGKVPVFAIQHGVSWDIPQQGLSKWHYFYQYIRKQYHAWLLAQRMKYIDNLVCVDCNFINWYKALVPYPKVRMHYVPNFSDIPQEPLVKPDEEDGVNIIFARRFEPQRGTRLFMKIAQRLLSDYNNITITIAGDGKDEKLLKENLAQDKRVEFIRYQSNESLKIHANKHIAVVPTLGSEGTSLSLLEAMASGCAVVCTNVGGMTNIIVNEYNGLMVAPEEEELYQAMKRLIEHKSERELFAQRGFESLLASFSLSKWQESWRKILQIR